MVSISKLFLESPDLPRDPGAQHRVATPLELFFDLVTVIAIASAVAGLHHAISNNHTLDGLIAYGVTFFVIWWAWMNYTWHASAYDNDNTSFRLLTMVAMTGSLVIAIGVDPLFKSQDISVVIYGYIIMRVAMIALWLRAAKYDSERKRTALTYAAGISIAQIYWVSLLFIAPIAPSPFYTLFGIGVVIELSVPAIAEGYGKTPWHKDHITERYGLLFIIVMGELLLGAALALKAGSTANSDLNLVTLALCSLVIPFSMWWLYFSREDHLQNRNLSCALIWGYGHVLIFAGAAAVGAGLAVYVDILTDHAKVGIPTAAKAVAVPLSLYLFTLWFVRDRRVLCGAAKNVLPLFAVLILSAAWLLMSLEIITALTVATVLARNGLIRRDQTPQVSP